MRRIGDVAPATGIRNMVPRGASPAVALVAALVTLSVAAPGRAQEPRAEPPELERIEAEFPAEVAERLRGIIERARDDGIPASLLVDKALEGAAKGVSGDRLLSTVSAYAGELRETRTLVGPDMDATGLLAANDALRRGVPPGVVRSLAMEHPAAFEMFLLVYGDLLDEGVPSDEAYGVVEAAAGQGLEGDRLLSVPGAVRRLIREGEQPVDAAASVEQRLKRGRFPFPPPGDAGPLPRPRDGRVDGASSVLRPWPG